jgi:hypothetical protein
MMKRYGIPRRTLSEAGMKFAKTSFSGNPAESAYLLGFRTGDLHATIDGNQIRLGTSTTHPAMWSLIHSLFHGYGRVNKTPARLRDGFEWSVYSYLDRSFEFLVKKPQNIPGEVSRDSTLFHSFLSGYIDAEGSFRIYRDEESCAVSLRINSEDEGILRGIRTVLSSKGYHPCFDLVRRKGFYKGKNYRKNVLEPRNVQEGGSFGPARQTLTEAPREGRVGAFGRDVQGLGMEINRPRVRKRRARIKEDVLGFTEDAKHQYAANHRSPE